ncbi:MAG: BlaI/MecI/CopY family transcriptional regulator [Gammaproteobacteria bacterium]|nr:BlaI/MecI/CopY family transcriptional regulator [Gammaproteobacteria bacterium]
MRLSDFELEVIQLFWQYPQLSAPQVHEMLGTAKGVTYSTIKTIIDRLEKKQALVRSEKQGRTIFYQASIASDAVRKPVIQSLIEKVFGGKQRSLMAHLIRDEKLSADDLDYLQDLLDAKKRKLMNEQDERSS